VFWIQDARYLVTALVAAVGTFFVARWLEPPRSFMELSDAIGLAMFTIIGAQKSLAYETGGTLAVAVGTITGVAGGIMREVLLNELPLVFRKAIRLYATAAVAGAGVYVLLKLALPRGSSAALAGSITVLAVRLAAMRWELALPLFQTRR
jgi:uncharacterized membrane protein YeiH